MDRYRKNIPVRTKVDARTYRMLEEKRKAGGFRSIYQLLQALLECFCRYSDPEYDRGKDKGMGKEIEDMFDELAGWETRMPYKGRKR